MEKLRIVPRDAMLFRMLHRNWMSPSDVARILHCKPTEAYNRVRRIANKRRLIAMRIDGEGEEKIMRYKNGERPKQIAECLRKAAPRDLSIEEISGETGIHRNTVSKYVYALEKEGKIILTRQVGGAKFYTVKEK